MKKLMLSFLLFPAITYGQIELGINGGITPFKANLHDNYVGEPKYQSSNNFTLSASYCFHKKFIIGAEYLSSRLQLNYNLGSFYGNEFQDFANPMSYYGLFAGYKLSYGIYSFIPCINYGIVNIKDANIPFGWNNMNSESAMYGLSISNDFRISKRFYANATIAVFTTTISLKWETENIISPTVYYYPITIGIHYRFKI